MLLPVSLPPAVQARLAARVGDAEISYGALYAAAAAHAASLASMGAAPGARVGVWATPAIETVVAFVGHALGGYVSVPINPASGPREVAHVVGDAGLGAVAGEAPPDGVAGARVVRVDPAGSGPASAFVEVGADAPALVLYTSGTTGAPKGAVLTHRNVASNLDALAAVWAWTAEDVLAHALPLFHVHGLALGLFGPLRRRGSVRVLPRFEPGAVCAAMGAEATMFFGVPTMYHRLAEHIERDLAAARALRKARVLVSGSAPLPSRDHARVEAATGRRLLERYGLTETLINTAVALHDEPPHGSVGRALPGVELRLVDDARSPVVDEDAMGEVAVRGPSVFAGYLDRPEATRAVLDEQRWFYTGDVATRDAAGFVKIVGRKATDIIKTGGFKVGAGEVEAALLEHPEVREAAVRGVADDDLGERIEAWVVLSEGAEAEGDALSGFVAERLAWHKRPRRVHVAEALPRNAMGKVVKSALRGPEGS
ncbi:MAG: AMP-binding protein [Polyangiales bacterium]